LAVEGEDCQRHRRYCTWKLSLASAQRIQLLEEDENYQQGLVRFVSRILTPFVGGSVNG